MAHLVSVSQLNSQTGKSFLNVDEDTYGSIGVWGSCYSRPTYLVMEDFQFHVQQFDNPELADEWLKTLADNCKVTKLGDDV